MRFPVLPLPKSNRNPTRNHELLNFLFLNYQNQQFLLYTWGMHKVMKSHALYNRQTCYFSYKYWVIWFFSPFLHRNKCYKILFPNYLHVLWTYDYCCVWNIIKFYFLNWTNFLFPLMKCYTSHEQYLKNIVCVQIVVLPLLAAHLRRVK